MSKDAGTDSTRSPRRVGIFGGTFDPIHNAHLRIARTALDAADLDEVVFMVAARPPHKRNDTNASPEQRLRMVEVALDGEEGMRVSDLELNRDGPSYTAETLEELARMEPDVEWFLLIGQDSLLDFPQWHEPQAILARARLLVVPRPGWVWTVPAELEGRYDVLPFAECDVSSTEIRERLQAGEDVSELVPESVLRLIEAEGIYDQPVEHRPRR